MQIVQLVQHNVVRVLFHFVKNVKTVLIANKFLYFLNKIKKYKSN